MSLKKFLRRSSSGGFLCVVVFTLCVLFKRTSREPSPRLTRGETRLAEKHCPNLLETFRRGANGDYYDCPAGQKVHRWRRHQTRLGFSVSVREGDSMRTFSILLKTIVGSGSSVCVHVNSPDLTEEVDAIMDCHQTPDSQLTTQGIPEIKRGTGFGALDGSLNCLRWLLEGDSMLPSARRKRAEGNRRRRPSLKYFLGLNANSLPLVKPDELTAALDRISESGTSQMADVDYSAEESVPKVFEAHPPPPFNLSLYSGIQEFIVNRSEAEFLLDHPVSRSLHRWLEDTGYPNPQGIYFSTLSRTRVNSRHSADKRGDIKLSNFVSQDPPPHTSRKKNFKTRSGLRDLPFGSHSQTEQLNFTLDGLFLRGLAPDAAACWAEYLGGG